MRRVLIEGRWSGKFAITRDRLAVPPQCIANASPAARRTPERRPRPATMSPSPRRSGTFVRQPAPLPKIDATGARGRTQLIKPCPARHPMRGSPRAPWKNAGLEPGEARGHASAFGDHNAYSMKLRKRPTDTIAAIRGATRPTTSRKILRPVAQHAAPSARSSQRAARHCNL